MYRLQIKSWLKNEKIKLLLISALIAALRLAIRHNTRLLYNLSDFLFVMGAVHVVVGGVRYIRNVGLFKTFSYLAYKRRWKSSGKAGGEVRPMSLAEFTANVIMDESRQRPCGYSLVIGVGLCVVSFIVAAAVPVI